MPYFSKQALSRYVATGCQRQLRLALSPHNRRFLPERAAQGMPPRQDPRPGLQAITEAGREWEAAKVADVAQTFGREAVVGRVAKQVDGQDRYEAIDLHEALSHAAPGKFLIEAEFDISPAFERAMGIDRCRQRFGLECGRLRPDLLEVLPPGHFRRRALPDGEQEGLPPADTRLQLRVIDVKLTAEPSVQYFAEMALYTMALAGWLEDEGLDRRFVAVPDAAVWPGSHEASRLALVSAEHRQRGVLPPVEALHAALEENLEAVPFEPFAYRLRRFFREELPEVLAQRWDALPFHVDNRCKGCDYLGYPWRDRDGKLTNHPGHCMPTAALHDHLCRVAFITRGASAALRQQGLSTVATLAGASADDPAFDLHHELRATRTVLAGRAAALISQQAAIPPGSGTSAVMPRWADLRVYLSADFDVGSAITLAFGLEAFWLQPLPEDAAAGQERAHKNWRNVFVVDQKSVEAERRELQNFLGAIHEVLEWARREAPTSTVQVYLWDTLQYDHLTRVIGRHLDAILASDTFSHLAWLFPPEQLLPNADLATRRSPVTVVRDVVRAVLAAPVPHYYSLLQVARAYHRPDLEEQHARFDVHPLFEDVLSDQVPSERAHEIWSRSARPHWLSQIDTLRRTVRRKLIALSEVTRRLEADLKPLLGQNAPPISAIHAPRREFGISADGLLWLAFARLDVALEELEVHRKRAMPPHEREARFDSARLERRLEGHEAGRALAALRLRPQPGRMVYTMRPASREVRLHESDWKLALSPEDQPGFLDRNFSWFTRDTWLQPRNDEGAWSRRNVEDWVGVSVTALDRDRGLIVLDAGRWSFVTDPQGRRVTTFQALETLSLADFSHDVILDPTHGDFFTRRLRDTLKAIGNPPAARASPVVQRAIGQSRQGARLTAHHPPADLLWCAPAMYQERVERDLGPIRAALVAHGRDLNATQWRAWEEALTRRLQLIWGPPGTGKSRTVISVILGAALEAVQRGRPLRILVAASTYTALDNVPLEAYQEAQQLLPSVYAEGVVRLRSNARGPQAHVPQAIDLELDNRSPSQNTGKLWLRLTQGREVTIVGAMVQQVHNLLAAHGSPRHEIFDLVVIDEASQMDVAHATLALAALARGGSVVLAGDPLQLSPIHQAEPPLGLEGRLGSIYTYCSEAHGVPAIMLDQCYRSNRALVEFTRKAGYQAQLVPYSPDLRLGLATPLPRTQPAAWPAGLYWTPEWATLLDPDHPAVCFAYPEGRSSQSNAFEADAVAALVWLLAGRLADRPENERDPRRAGALRPPSVRPYDPVRFWKDGIGVVTPHRAQQGLIVSRLRDVFPDADPTLVRDAVDTVERFQGQQRDAILASFAVGDPDAIFEEDEFLHSLNRFNVLASRARTKLVVLVSQEIVDHLSGDLDVLRASRLLKSYCQSFCREARPLALGYLARGQPRAVQGTLRWRALS